MRPQSDAPSADRPDSTRPEPRSADTALPSNGVLPPQLLDALFQQELLDHGPPLYVANLEGRIVWANAGYRRLSDAARGPLLPTEEIAAEIALLGSMVFREDVLTLGDGAQRLRSRHVPLRDAGGQMTAIAGIVQVLPEESQRLEAIATLRDRIDDMMRLVSDWAWETDAELKLTAMSNRVTEMLGYHPRELIGRNLLSLANGDSERNAIELRFQRHSPFRNQPVDMIAKSEEVKTFLLSAVPVFNFTTGVLMGYRGTATDVTELRKREVGLRVAKEMAEMASRAKTEFLANMSHELRTPLNAIIGFAEVMHMELLGPIGNQQYRGYIGDIHDSARHLLGLINDILDVAKIEAGRVELSETTTQVKAIFDAVARLIRERSVRAEVRLEMAVTPDLPPLLVDERKLKQILINLLSNAVKFTPAGGAIRMAAQPDPATGDLVITVADTGIGIAPADIARVMEPFGQVDNPINRKYRGTGLGLPLTKGLVELHGGSFQLESTPGVGTTVTIRLPAHRLKR
ncbi:MAG TPA: ATP-binding protein [Candidatus Acidoferrum sp.]|nr:ATP-binding protein [Candidatus Acidoferrum sp.]